MFISHPELWDAREKVKKASERIWKVEVRRRRQVKLVVTPELGFLRRGRVGRWESADTPLTL